MLYKVKISELHIYPASAMMTFMMKEKQVQNKRKQVQLHIIRIVMSKKVVVWDDT